jgi:hypothetical protein
MLIAVKADSGISDLHEIKEKRLPVRVLVLAQGGDTNAEILTYYGLTKEALASWEANYWGTPRGSRKNGRILTLSSIWRTSQAGIQPLDRHQPESGSEISGVAKGSADKIGEGV